MAELGRDGISVPAPPQIRRWCVRPIPLYFKVMLWALIVLTLFFIAVTVVTGSSIR
jgi:hypothetical protein